MNIWKRIFIACLGFSVFICSTNIIISSEHIPESNSNQTPEDTTRPESQSSSIIIAEKAKNAATQWYSNRHLYGVGSAALLGGMAISYMTRSSQPQTEARLLSLAIPTIAAQVGSWIYSSAGTLAVCGVGLYAWHELDGAIFGSFREKIKEANKKIELSKSEFARLDTRITTLENASASQKTTIQTISQQAAIALHATQEYQAAHLALSQEIEQAHRAQEGRISALEQNQELLLSSAKKLYEKCEDGSINHGFLMALLKKASQEVPIKKKWFERIFPGCFSASFIAQAPSLRRMPRVQEVDETDDSAQAISVLNPSSPVLPENRTRRNAVAGILQTTGPTRKVVRISLSENQAASQTDTGAGVFPPGTPRLH